MKLPPGKIPLDILKGVVFKNLGAERSEVVLGPAAGLDGAVLDVGSKNAIVSMDPITGAVERIGWEAININANDVATFGVEPAFFFSCLLLPENADSKIVETISTQMNAAAGLGIRVFEEKITVEPETAKICRYYEIDPLQLISSGALLIAAQPEAANKIIDALSLEHIYADVIGEFNPNPNKRILLHKDNTAEMLA